MSWLGTWWVPSAFIGLGTLLIFVGGGLSAWQSWNFQNDAAADAGRIEALAQKNAQLIKSNAESAQKIVENTSEKEVFFVASPRVLKEPNGKSWKVAFSTIITGDLTLTNVRIEVFNSTGIESYRPVLNGTEVRPGSIKVFEQSHPVVHLSSASPVGGEFTIEVEQSLPVLEFHLTSSEVRFLQISYFGTMNISKDSSSVESVLADRAYVFRWHRSQKLYRMVFDPEGQSQLNPDDPPPLPER